MAEVAFMTWKKLLEPDGTYAVDEGERYLFAIATHRVNSYDSGWFYFVDALVWDAETPPQWSTDEHGYSGCEDEMWFMPLPEPPEADQPAPTETGPYEPHPAQVADRGAEHYGVREFAPQGAPQSTCEALLSAVRAALEECNCPCCRGNLVLAAGEVVK